MVETVLCYIEKDHQYLMMLRNKKTNDLNHHKWIGVGGKIEINETPDEALLREVYEETSLKLLNYHKRAVITFINDDYKEVMHLYTSNSFKGNVKQCSEGTLSWIKFEEIFNLNLWEGDKVFLEKLINDDEFFSLTLYYEKDQLKSYKWR